MLAQLTLAALLLSQPASSGPAEVSQDERIIRLLNLTDGYFKSASPPPDSGTANVVEVAISVIKLNNVDVVKQEVSLDTWIVMSWIDSRLAWEYAEETGLANVSHVFVPLELLWQPDLTSSDQQVATRNLEGLNVLAILQRNGTVSIGLLYSIKFKCLMKMQDFPFDTQKCSFSLLSAVKSVKYLELRLLQEKNRHHVIDEPNNEYCVPFANTSIQTSYHEYPNISVTFEFKRKPMYYVTVLIIPSALILITCLFGYLLTAESGDRLALNVAILLSMSVFLQLAGSSTPAQSESVPALTWYFTVAMAVTTLTTIGSILVHFCYQRAKSQMTVDNRLLRLLFLNRLCGWTDSEFHPTTNVAHKTDGVGDSSGLETTEPVAMETTDTTGASISPRDGTEWLQIGMVLDRALLCGSILACCAIAIFLTVTAVKDDPAY